MRLFVTGTDTDVGKTVVTAALAAAARPWGAVIAAKPVASGVAPGAWGEDAEALGRAAGHPPRVFTRYEPPVSPHRAILDGGATVDRAALARWIRDLRADTVLVEGVGGWRVPIQLEPRIECSDLARWTAGPVIVVARDRLGVLSHTRLTVDAVRNDGLEVRGVVLNRVPGADPPRANHEDLRLLLDVPVALMEPLDPADPGALTAAGAALWSALHGHAAGP